MTVIDLATTNAKDEQGMQQRPKSPNKSMSANHCAEDSGTGRMFAPLKYIVEVVLPIRDIKNAGKPKTKTSLKVKVNGETFEMRTGFDTFWKYASKRNQVEENRRSGKPQPWSNNRILQEYKFCSVFRVADRGCQFLINEVIEKGSQEEEEVLFRVLLYSSFIRVETYQLLERKLGPLTWETFDRQKYSDVLSQALSRGRKIFTGAFQKHGPKFGSAQTHDNHLVLLEVMMDDDLLERLKECKYMADAFDVLYKYPGSGDFTAFQLLINLSYTSILNFNEDSFVIPGPGAIEGLNLCFSPSESIKGRETELIKWMTDTQEEHFSRLGLVPATLGKEKRRMTMVDVEHTLCELQKYVRYASSQCGTGRLFKPHSQHLPRWPKLPRAWAHPARTKVRVKPGRKGTDRAEKMYVVNRLLGERENEEGEREYLVDWLGYGPESRTWEPAEGIRRDAPKVVAEYDRLRSSREGEDEGEPKRKKKKV